MRERMSPLLSLLIAEQDLRYEGKDEKRGKSR